jgi:membrane protease YdiL (CAAX protease family)
MVLRLKMKGLIEKPSAQLILWFLYYVFGLALLAVLLFTCFMAIEFIADILHFEKRGSEGTPLFLPLAFYNIMAIFCLMLYTLFYFSKLLKFKNLKFSILLAAIIWAIPVLLSIGDNNFSGWILYNTISVPVPFLIAYKRSRLKT